MGVDEGRKVGIMRPGGGAVSEWLLRPIAIGLATQAMQLVTSVFAAFEGIPRVDDLWKAEGKELSEKGIAALTAEVKALEPLKGDVASLQLLRSDEVPL